MVEFSLSYGRNRIVGGGQDDLIFRPRNGERGRRGIVLLGGQLQVPPVWNQNSAPFQQALFRALAQAAIPGVAIDAGVAAWGNDVAVADIELARLYLANQGCATDKIVLVGASAGVTDALNYTREYPSRVAAVICIMPAVDLDDCRDNNRAGTAKANINTAWGMPVGSTSATDPLPSRANPNTTTNAALIASSGATIKLYYSSVDTVVIPSTVESFAAKLGITPTIISSTHDHSDTLFGDVPTEEFTRTIAGVL